VLSQGKLMDSLSKKLASNDKTLETNAIKNQLSFNKMLESQLQHLANFVPSTDQGKMSGQLEGVETTNLIDIFNAGSH
jgi:hypothetical protein